MPVLSRNHPIIGAALDDARRWCAGHTIDERPALAHAVRVAVTLTRHLPDPAPVLLAAALLHDAPEFAPPTLDLDAVLTATYGPEVPRIVRALQVEHHALDTPSPSLDVDDPPVLLASTADKIVALTSLHRRAHRSGDITGFFAARPALVALLPHFRAFTAAGAGRVPVAMTAALDHAVTALVTAATP